MVAVGTNDDDITTAINAVIAEKGGLAISAGGTTDILPPPIAGLMSPRSCDEVAVDYQKLDQRVKQLGSTLRSPYMTLSFMALSFMALLVIPSLKLSDKSHLRWRTIRTDVAVSKVENLFRHLDLRVPRLRCFLISENSTRFPSWSSTSVFTSYSEQLGSPRRATCDS